MRTARQRRRRARRSGGGGVAGAAVRLHVAREFAALCARVAAQRTPVRAFSGVTAPVYCEVRAVLHR